MRYEKPELMPIDRAEQIVLGGPPGTGDNMISLVEQPEPGFVLGLDE